jgi:hypothetical protein
VKKLTRILLALLGLGLVLIVVIVITVWVWVNRYLRGDELRQVISQKTSIVLSTPGEYLPLHWSGFSVHSDGFFAKGESGATLEQVRADQIRAEVNFRALLHRTAQIDLLTIEKISLRLQTNPTLKPNLTPSNPSSSNPTTISSFTPNQFVLQRAQVKEALVTWEQGNETIGELSGVALEATPEGQAWNILGKGGIIKQRGLPDFQLERFKTRIREPEIFLTEVILRHPEQGEIAIQGEASWDEKNRLDLHLDLKEVTVTPFLPEDWRARLTGKLVGDSHITRQQTEPLRAQGKLQLIDGRLEALPALDQIAFFTQVKDFKSLKIHLAQANYLWTEKSLEITNLVLESFGLLRIEGQFRQDGDSLQGLFQVGTKPETLRLIPGARTQVFTTERDGYVWAPLTLSGTIQDPKEDLSPRLKTAALQAVGEGVKEGVKDLKKNAETILDGVISVLPLR